MNGEQAMEAVLKPGGALVDEPSARRIVEFVADRDESGGNGQLAPSGDLTRLMSSRLCWHSSVSNSTAFARCTHFR